MECDRVCVFCWCFVSDSEKCSLTQTVDFSLECFEIHKPYATHSKQRRRTTNHKTLAEKTMQQIFPLISPPIYRVSISPVWCTLEFDLISDKIPHIARFRQSRDENTIDELHSGGMVRWCIENGVLWKEQEKKRQKKSQLPESNQWPTDNYW